MLLTSTALKGNKSKDFNNPWWSSKLQNQRKEIKSLKKTDKHMEHWLKETHTQGENKRVQKRLP